MTFSQGLPERFGPYRVRRKLGQGGMGIVYEAHDEKLERSLAVKVIARDVADEDAIRRFWREARAAAAVNHPNVCQLYEIGEHEGALYIAMELLEGEPLAERLRRGALPLAEAFRAAGNLNPCRVTRRGIRARRFIPGGPSCAWPERAWGSGPGSDLSIDV